MVLRHITQWRFREFRSPKFSARFPTHQRVAPPMHRTKARIENHPDSALVLWAVLDDRRFVAHVGEIFRVSWRETVVLAFLDMEQLIQRVPIREPRRAFLVGREQVPVLI